MVEMTILFMLAQRSVSTTDVGTEGFNFVTCVDIQARKTEYLKDTHSWDCVVWKRATKLRYDHM